MFNGIWPEPTIKRFNSGYLQIKYLISRKIHSNTFWLDKTFIFLSQVTMMFQKKRFFKNNTIRVRFSIVDIPATPAKQKKTSSPWKIIEIPHLRKSGRGRWSVVIVILLKLFFFKIHDLVHRRTSAPVAAGNCRIDGATDFLATIWQHITTVSCFYFGFDQEAQKCFLMCLNWALT